ncbi:MAG: hypothetical protein A2096_05585 [Spirochaetes bacterium GWF1_41_5]|nr:MAG: hypothetical protein A2096_05585 [Spirochaetes bacterium GWF1_41_5]
MRIFIVSGIQVEHDDSPDILIYIYYIYFLNSIKNCANSIIILQFLQSYCCINKIKVNTRILKFKTIREKNK